VLIVAYRAHSIGGTLAAGDDAIEAGLFAPDDWPQEPLPESGAAIDEWFYGVIRDVLARWQPAKR
ncbi:MAG: ADP-ribose pyrophosphatase, partial [Rhodocyclaceae bacterium]|nr:ADP-ribose pyrophosphatase [Rhodocyclaceae bacterium]